MSLFSFLLAAVKGLRKKKKKEVKSKADEFERRRRRRAIWSSPNSKKLTGFDNLPEELIMKILSSFPAKEVTRLMCVSQLWYSLIASSYFTKLFLKSPSSAKRPRLIVSLVDKSDQRKYRFYSSSSTHHNDHSDTSVCVLDKFLNMPGLGGYFVNALYGLLCVRIGRSMRIFNLTTKQRVTLPIIRSSLLNEANVNIWNSFAHDPVHNEYKVLSTVWEVSEEEEGRVVRSEHQVLVLGPEASLRKTKGHIYPHRPYSYPMTINGVLYYRAWIVKNTCMVMSFDLASEEFKVIELPIEAGIIWYATSTSLMNYGDKLAVFEYSRLPFDGSMNLWGLEDAGKGKWSNKITLVLPFSNMNFVHGEPLGMVGTGRRGLVLLVKSWLLPYEGRPCAIYDLENNKIISIIEICALPFYWFWRLKQGLETVLWQDDIENIMYLET